MIKSIETERLISRTDDLVRYAEKHGSAVSGFFDAASVSVVGEHLSRLGLAARGLSYCFFGGYAGAERQVLVIVDTAFCPYGYFCGDCLTRAGAELSEWLVSAEAIGGCGDYGYDGNVCAILTAIDEQSPDIAQGVDKALEYKDGTLEDTGDLLDELPKDLKVKQGNFFTEILGITHAEAKAKGIFVFLNRSFWTVMTRFFKTGAVFGILAKMQKDRAHYDCAVSFMQNGEERVFYGGWAEYVLNSVNADKKICFVHCDFENYGGNCEYNRKTLAKFDAVAAVSDAAAKRLKKTVPGIADKAVCVHNCCNIAKVKEAGEAYIAEHSPGKVNFFTASRLHSEKGILRMLPIFRGLKLKGLDFIWRIAGDGPDKAEILRITDEYGLKQNIVLLGNLKNPYPYFKSADALLVPSYNEAAPMVFSEARIFGTPIITTNTLSAEEMVTKTNAGIVCENNDAALSDCVEKFIRNFTPSGEKHTAEIDNQTALSEFDALVGE